MRNNATIYICGTQLVDDDSDSIELTTEGVFRQKDGSFFLSYDEDELSGIKGSRTTIKIDGNKKAVITKSGATHSTLIIEPDRRNICRYETEYGDLVFGISDSTIRSRLDKNGGRVKIEYSLDANYSLLSKNKLEIKVRLN